MDNYIVQVGLGTPAKDLSLIFDTGSDLTSSSSSIGFLTFGGGSKTAKFTQFSSSSAVPSNFYGLNFTEISVGGNKLVIPQSAFTTIGVIINFDTVIMRLPPVAYSALHAAFWQGMSKCPTASVASILDTCYDLSAYTSDFSIPTLQVLFNGRITVNIAASSSHRRSAWPSPRTYF